MPEILPEHVPSPRTMLVWDGAAYRPVNIETGGGIEVAGGEERICTPWEVATIYFPRAADSAIGRLMGVANFFWTGASWAQEEGNILFQVFPSAVRNATVNGPALITMTATKLFLTFQIWAVPGVDTVTLQVWSGEYYGCTRVLLLEGPPMDVVGQQAFYIGDGIGGGRWGVTETAPWPLPRDFRVTIVHSGVGNFTYAVAGVLLR